MQNLLNFSFAEQLKVAHNLQNEIQLEKLIHIRLSR